MFELDVDAGDVGSLLVFHLEHARRAEGDRSDHRRGPELRFVVRVPRDAVETIAVEVEQDAVELVARLVRQPTPNISKRRRPGQRIVANPGVDVARLGISVPGGQARRQHFPPVENRGLLFPLRLVSQCGEEAICSGHAEKTSMQTQVRIG